MADLFWPGDDRAGNVFSQSAFLAAMVQVESAWLAALVAADVAPARARADLTTLLDTDDREDIQHISARAESGGNPVIPMIELLRSRSRDDVTTSWIHRGLTSQDVVDTALMLCARKAVDRILDEIGQQAATLAGLADSHRSTVMAGRTLTQHAVPTTFGLKTAQWLDGVLDARDQLTALELPAQLGGAAGTLAAAVELARLASATDPAKVARTVATDTATRLGLADRTPWHTRRTPVTRTGDALVAATAAWGHIANDVLVLARPEIGELAEAPGRGGSSTMPNKANPILSVLLRRAALTAPTDAARLHLASAESVDERTPGGWHVEWSTLATLARRTVVAASQATELLDGLQVDTGRMSANVRAAASDLLAEQAGLVDQLGGRSATDPASYVGASDRLVDIVLDRYRAGRT